jgi:N-acetylglucosamine repressor
MQKNDKAIQAARPAHVRQVNLQAAVRQMRQMSLFSKIDLARELGISTTTMTKLFAQLEAGGIIERSPEIDKSFGRPKILYRLSPAPQIGAVIIEIDTTTLCISGLQGDIRPDQQLSFPTGSRPETLFPAIGKNFSRLWKRCGGDRCRIIGVCIQGLIEAESGQSMLNPNLHWLEGTRPAEEISRRLGIPAILLHEAKAISRAQLTGAGNTAEALTIDFSAGVGMSVISNGQYLTGQSGFAGEIGHIIMNPGGALCGCGNRGCLETVAADRVFFQTLETSGRRRAVRDILHWQSTGIAAAINLFNPQTVCIHSLLFDEIPDYLERLREQVAQKAMAPSAAVCSLQRAVSGKLKGTLLSAVDRALSDPVAVRGEAPAGGAA